MDFVKFWQIVEKHQWLLRVIGSLWDDLEDGTALNDPGSLGYRLSPSTIESDIAYIAFRPWGNLPIAETDSISIEVKDDKSETELRQSLSTFVYWHSEGENPFVSRTEVVTPLTLKKALEILKGDGQTIDGVVRRTSVIMDGRMGLKSPVQDLSELVARLKADIERFQYRHSYDIYLPEESEMPIR